MAASDLHNVGDLVLLLQCAHGLRSCGMGERIWVRTWAPPPAAALRQLRSADIGVLRARRAEFARCAGAHLVFAGGQAVRRNVSRLNLLQDLVLSAWVRATGGRTSMLACGVERITDRRAGFAWRLILRGLAIATVRDEISRVAFKDITRGGATPVLTDDLAFLPSLLHDGLSARVETDTLLISPCVEASEHRGFDFDHVLDLVRSILVTRALRRVAVLAHDPRDHVDGSVAERLRRELSASSPNLEIVLISSNEVSDYLAEYARASLVVTNRLHAAIFAILSAAEVLVLDDGLPKLRQLALRFHLASTSAYSPDPTDELLRSLARSRGRHRERGLVLAEAKANAARNFELLAAERR